MEENEKGALRGDGNVYADLGVPNAEEMLIKAQLVNKINDIIKRRKLSQQEAAGILGISQAKVSDMLRGRFRGISEAKMLECLTRLGRDIQIVVKPNRSKHHMGTIKVMFS